MIDKRLENQNVQMKKNFSTQIPKERARSGLGYRVLYSLAKRSKFCQGIGAKPGGAYIPVDSHRRVLPQSRQIFQVAPWVSLRQNMLVARSD